MGDRIAIFSEGGVLEQYATPTQLLASPANDFVVDFLGPERNLKRLALIPTSQVEAQPGPCVSANDTPAHASKEARKSGTNWVFVLDDERRVKGWLPTEEIEGHQKVSDVPSRPFREFVASSDSLRVALDAMVESPNGAVVRVDEEGRYEGTITQETFPQGLE